MGRREDFYVALGQRVRELRTAKGMTQAQLGELLVPRVTRASVANLEAGKQRVLAHTLVDLARALDVLPAKLLPVPVAGEGSKEPARVAAELRKKLPKLPDPQLKELAKRLLGPQV